jgi:hypothetical protein
LTEVLTDQVNPNWVQDRLVIIGTTANSLHPGFYTPYSSLSDQPARIPRIFVHAQIASQIMTTVLDGRPLMYYWPDWAELLWIWSCSLVRAVLAWQWRHPLMFLLLEGFIFVGVVVITAGFYLQAIWIPLFAPALGLVFSGLAVMGYTTYQTQKQNQTIVLKVEQQEDAITQLGLLLEQTTELPSNFDDFKFAEISIFKTDELLLAGGFKISKSLASGGFSCTYLAEDTKRKGNPICVVKELMPTRRDPKLLQVARRLFNTEAEILAVLGKHPQITELFTYFEEDQEFYLVQEYILGNTLSKELTPEKGAKTEAYVVNIIQ